MQKNNPQFVDSFPQAPVEGAVYFTPSMPSAEARMNLPLEDQISLLERRGDVLRGVGQASVIHIADLRAQNVALSAEKAEAINAKEEALKTSLTDALTGLQNRRAFYEKLAAEVERVQGDPDPRLILMYIDLDEFKSLNDTHGHDQGDNLLRRIGSRFAQFFRVRKEDSIYRIGGDEFAALINGKKPEDQNDRRHQHEPEEAVEGLDSRITEVVERATRETEADINAFRKEDGESVTLGVSASVGSVVYIPGETAEEFLKRADAAMYEIKRQRKAQKIAEQQA